MKRLASKAIAASLVAAFAFAASPGSAEPPVRAEQTTALGTPAALRDQKYRELVQLLEQEKARQEARRAAIAAEIKAGDATLSDDQIAVRAEQQLSAELRREEEDRWNARVNQSLGRPHTDLPRIFERAVRGCTQDGYIFRMTYNLTFNMDEIAAPPAAGTPAERRSLFYRLVRPDPESILGVTGTDRFMEALKAMNGSVDTAMQTVAGRLIDEATSDFIVRPIFQELAGYAVQNIADDVRQRYGVTVTIRLEQPRQQGQARCAVPGAPAPVGTDAPMITPPPGP